MPPLMQGPPPTEVISYNTITPKPPPKQSDATTMERSNSTLPSQSDSLLPSIAYAFLARDRRPTFVFQQNPSSNISYALLFQNPASLKHAFLNETSLHQSLSELPAGTTIKVNGWNLDITILDNFPDVRVVTASRPRVNSQDLGDIVLAETKTLDRKQLLADAGVLRSRSYSTPDHRKWDTKFSPMVELPNLMEEEVPQEVRTDERVQRKLTDWRVRFGQDLEGQDIEDERLHGEENKEDDDGESHFKMLRSVPWENTEFGPMNNWGALAQTAAAAMMLNPMPTAVYWGPNYECIFNEAWLHSSRGRNAPELLGKRFKDAWPELWDKFKPLLDGVYYDGQRPFRTGEYLTVKNAQGEKEECYFNIALFPIIDPETGFAEGVAEIAFEQTEVVINARRTDTLTRLQQNLRPVSQNLEDNEYWASLVATFDQNPEDSPLLIVYKTASVSDDTVQNLQHVFGVPRGGSFAPYMCCVSGPVQRRSPGVFNAEMRKAKEQNTVIIKDVRNECSLKEVSPRGFREVPTHVAVMAVKDKMQATKGFVILGLNPRRPLDAGYKRWLNSIKDELENSASAAWCRQQELLRTVRQGGPGTLKSVNMDLHAQLQQKTAELHKSETFFAQTTEQLPCGIALINLEGRVCYSNAAARELFRVKTDKELDDGWRQLIYYKDAARACSSLEIGQCLKPGYLRRIEYRIGNDNGPQGWRYWVASTTIPQVDSYTGKIARFMVQLVDITSHKKVVEYERQLSTQQVERRKQQEIFIDMFSHELRNPFSATLQSADAIIAALKDRTADTSLKECLESAETIVVCVRHQMRIIDDVLTLSKLESMALSVVPTSIRIEESIVQMMGMFKNELASKCISCTYVISPSWRELGLTWVLVDPARFSQILINLLTNAIKFTAQQPSRRQIIVELGASVERPTHDGNVVYHVFNPPNSGNPHPDDIYLQLKVTDTGIGISNKYQNKLFGRFEQVPKTHITYGGSGLGLFISRRLCRLQGGEIGVKSSEGNGSSFAFFIKAQRTTQPEKNPESPKKTDSKKHYHVLIVEDNRVNSTVLSRQLTKAGCTCHVAMNGKDAIEFLKSTTFATSPQPPLQPSKSAHAGPSTPDSTPPIFPIPLDIVLMDLAMPVMDGNTATRKIREMTSKGELNDHVPIVGISANAREEVVKGMQIAGMDDAVEKPFGIADVLGRFQEVFALLGQRNPETAEEVEGVKEEDGSGGDEKEEGSEGKKEKRGITWRWKPRVKKSPFV